MRQNPTLPESPHNSVTLPSYADAHGPAEQSLLDRLALIESLLSGTARHTLVEIGCGTGLILEEMAKRQSAPSITGVDLTEAMLAIARKPM